MSSVDVKECYKPSPKSYNRNKRAANSRKSTSFNSRTPSKWDDAQKWLVIGHSNGAKPRNSNADDRRLIDGDVARDDAAETKKIDFQELPPVPVRSVCRRDVGTEMTPIASREASRSVTPLRRSPSPITSPEVGSGGCSVIDASRKFSALESRASAWDEAERAKYLARYKREEVKIEAWEDHLARKAERNMKRVEVKAERLKRRAREKLASKMASTRRVAEEKRSSAEASLNERAARTSEKADYIRRTGAHLPSSFFSLTLRPSMCR